MELGIFYALAAGLFWGASPVLVKRGLANSDVSAATMIQQGVTLAALVLFTLFEGNVFSGSISKPALSIFIVAGIVGAYLGRTLFVKTIAELGAARAQALNNSSPLITVLLAVLFLGEVLTVFVAAGVLLIVSGVFFITRPEPQTNGPANRLLTVTSVLALISYGIVPVLKKLATDYGGAPVFGALVMHATGLVLLLAFGSLLKLEFKWQKLPIPSLLCFAASGVLQAAGSILTLKALLYAPASVVAPVWNIQPIVSFFLARATLKGIEEVTLRDGLAAALVVLGVLVLRWG